MKSSASKTNDLTPFGNCLKPLLANRYFIVFYFGTVKNGNATGYMDFTTYEGAYLNKAMTIIQLSKNNLNLTNIVITNILELNEVDFNEWCL